MANRVAIIKLMPDAEEDKADIQTNGLTHLEMLDMLESIQKHFARALLDEVRGIVGDDQAAQEAYIDRMRRSKDN